MFLACCRSPSVGIFLSPHFAELVGDARRFSFNDSQNALGHIAALDAFFGKFSLPVRALYLFAGWARPRPLPEERADRRALAHLFRQHHDGALATTVQGISACPRQSRAGLSSVMIAQRAQ